MSEEKVSAKNKMLAIFSEDEEEKKEESKVVDRAYFQVLNMKMKEKQAVKEEKDESEKIILNDDYSRELVQFLALKKRMAKEKIELDELEKGVLSVCEEHQEKQSSFDNYRSSYIVESFDGKTRAKFMSSNMFYPVQTDDEQQALEVLMGKDAYDKCIEKKAVVSLRPEVMNDESLKLRLVELLGTEYDKFFETTKTYEVKEDFVMKMFNLIRKNKNYNKIKTMLKRKKSYIKEHKEKEKF